MKNIMKEEIRKIFSDNPFGTGEFTEYYGGKEEDPFIYYFSGYIGEGEIKIFEKNGNIRSHSWAKHGKECGENKVWDDGELVYHCWWINGVERETLSIHPKDNIEDFYPDTRQTFVQRRKKHHIKKGYIVNPNGIYYKD